MATRCYSPNMPSSICRQGYNCPQKKSRRSYHEIERTRDVVHGKVRREGDWLVSAGNNFNLENKKKKKRGSQQKLDVNQWTNYGDSSDWKYSTEFPELNGDKYSISKTIINSSVLRPRQRQRRESVQRLQNVQAMRSKYARAEDCWIWR